MVICPPFGEERKSAARVMTRTARAFCEAGVCVLRFDYRGTGESDGELTECRLTDWLADIAEARAHLASRSGATRVGLLGIRFGAALAAAACIGSPASFLVLWLPLFGGKACLDEVVRRMAATRLVRNAADGSSGGQNGLDLGGLFIGKAMRADLEAFDVSRDTGPGAELVLSVQFSRQAAVAGGDAETCRRLTRPGGTSRVLCVPGRPFWVTASRFDPRDLIAATLEPPRSCGLLGRESAERAPS
jgi:pimeloyl-ACP methyl ester carboxylesterase